MSENRLEEIERELGRATDLEDEAAIERLSDARDELRELEGEDSVDEERRDTLETQLEQRLREVDERENYDTQIGENVEPAEEESRLGAASNPDEEDAA